MGEAVISDQSVLEDLLAACARQDARALAELYRQTAPQVLACVMQILRRRALAEEVLQDVYLQVWQRAAQFDAHRGRPLAWLISLSRYRAIDILRRERSDSVDPFALAETLADQSEDMAAAVTGHADERVLKQCLAQLSADQRECIRLAFLGGRSHPEVAAALHRPLGSVKSWIRRGLTALKECMESCAIRTTP
jgi:RNA polymerase sigma factor (sigma-70 family)